MDFTHEQSFSAKRAGGIGLSVVLHVVAACGLIYGLHRTFTLPSPPLSATFAPPTKPTIKEEPVDHAFKPAANPLPVIHQLELPPIVMNNPNTITPALSTKSGKTPAGPAIDGPHIPIEGSSHTGISMTKPAITNLDACKPEYPRSSIMNEEKGIVRVQFEIGADNRLISASVLKSSGHRALDNAAVNALSRCEFKAAIRNGVPVSSSFVTDYVWNLQAE